MAYGTFYTLLSIYLNMEIGIFRMSYTREWLAHAAILPIILLFVTRWIGKVQGQ